MGNNLGVLVIDENKISYNVKYENDHVKVDEQSYYEPGLTHKDQVTMAVDYHHCTVVQFSYDNGKNWNAYGTRGYK